MQGNNKSGLTRRDLIKTAGLASVALPMSATLAKVSWAAEAPPTIPVGQIVPFTGSAAEFGKYYRDAAQLAFDQINTAAKEAFGGPIIGNHITADSNTLPTPAIAAARKMVEADNVPAIIAAWSSGVTVAIATSVTIPSGVLQVGNGTTSPLVSVLPEDAKADLLFRTSPSDALQGVVAADLATGKIIPDYKFAKVSTVYINNPYGQGLSNAFTAAFEKRGGKVLAQIAHPEEVQPTYKAQIQAALEGKPDMILAVTYPAHTAAIVKEARDIFNFTNFQFTDANRSDDVLKAVGAETLKGKLGTVPSADPTSPTYKEFSELFMKTYKYDHVPPFTETTYDAALVIGLAMAKAVADGKKAGDITGKVLAENLRPVCNPPGDKILGANQESITNGLKLIAAKKDTDYVGTGGSVDFDDNGDVKTPIAIWKWTDTGTEDVKIVPAADIPSE
ncbi:MAG: ABC transporter substrate-binding protein [Hyphomicrobiales bacterium]|nr:ABC transporter substrate-binding protein [Hyphomicrobiales bacterium]